ncbi:Gpr1 family protein [Crassisporium funariophilum]|nr:Gpr1 family protein [Crassisporium funariophilum]
MSNEKNGDIERDSVIEPLPMKRRPSRIANPGPAGIFSFASTTFMLSMFNVNTRGIHNPNVVVGMALFTGGLLQFIAGMWEFPRGNLWAATAFSSYGCFWMSYATIFIPSSGILAAYTDPQELNNAVGIYLIAWFMFTFMMLLPVLRRNLALTILLTCLSVAFILLAVGSFMAKASITKGGGIMGIITALVAYYIGMSDMMEAEPHAIFRLPKGIWYPNE